MVKSVCFSFLVLCLVAGLEAKGTWGNLDIIGGNKTDIHKHPYQVAVWSGDEFRGSGALLAKNWVITTASVVTGFDAQSLSVRCHSVSASSGGLLYNVNKVLIHPKFRFSTMMYDVALLRLKEKVKHWLKVQLARVSLPLNVEASLSGWGSSSNTTKMSDTLLEAGAKAVEDTPCKLAYRQVGYTQMCVRAVNVYGPCWGDGGDLLIYSGRLYGLLSWNLGCYSEAAPSLFTDISPVRIWVGRTMNRTDILMH